MKIDKIQSYITPKTTGYASLTGLGLSIAAAYGKSKSIKKAHKPLAYITALTTLVHVGQIEYYHYKYKNNK